MGKFRKNFYAVRVGRNTGIYNSWSECEAQVKQYPGARYKGFADHSEAESFVNGGGGGNYGRTPSYSSASTSYRGSAAHKRYSGNFTSRYLSSNSSDAESSYSYRRPSTSSSAQVRPVVYSDGCCLNNGCAGARAGVGVYWGEGSTHNISDHLEGHPTNQRAELVAACRAIESAISQGFSSVEVRTDSSYTIKAATEWIDKWKSNGWRTSTQGDVKNKLDIQRLDGLCRKMDVQWTHVNGHVGIPGNEAADSLAKLGSRKS